MNNEKILKIAVVGLNSTGIGNVYVKNILENPRAQLAAVCEIDEAELKERVGFYGLPDEIVYTDYNEMLAKADIDAVCIATSDEVHCEIAVATMKAGYDVMCEKPLALSAHDCYKLIDVSNETGKKLFVGQICRFTPSFVMAKKLCDSGEIGELTYIESEYAHKYANTGKGWRQTNPDRNLVIGGGCHAVDLVRWIAGNPLEVAAFGNRKVCDTWPYDDTTIASMKFENNVIGKIMVSGSCVRAYTMRTVIHGTEGSIIVDNTSPYLILFKHEFGGMTEFCDTKMHRIEIRIPVEINNHNVCAELNYFIDGLTGAGEIKIDGREGCNTVIACDAIVQSANSGKIVKPEYSQM